MTTETMPAMLTDEQIRQIALGAGCSPAFDDGGLVYQLCRDVEQAVLQSPEIQALRKDAERYRHLRDFMRTGPRDVFGVWWLSEQGYPTTLDEALDISIKEES